MREGGGSEGPVCEGGAGRREFVSAVGAESTLQAPKTGAIFIYLLHLVQMGT